MSVTLKTDILQFPATQVPSADVNALDDYEEGTFTPTLTFGGAATGMTFSKQSGRYTKVGRVVHFSIRLALTAKGSSTGAALINALPFTSLSDTGTTYHPASIYANTMASITGVPTALVMNNASSIELDQFASNAQAVLTDANFTNTSDLILAGHYITA